MAEKLTDNEKFIADSIVSVDESLALAEKLEEFSPAERNELFKDAALGLQLPEEIANILGDAQERFRKRCGAILDIQA